MEFCSELCINILIDGLKNSKTNLVLSPMSYNIILNMIAGGATGSTLKEMLEFLQCPEITAVNSNSEKMMGLTSDGGGENGGEGGAMMQCLNGLWFDRHYRLKDSYQELARKIYNAHIKCADFENKADEVVEDVNAWAEESTKGLVRNILQHGDLDNETLVLGNAIYFKGFWRHAFDPKKTQDMPFYLSNGEKKLVPFMTNERYHVSLLDGFEVVKILYQNGEKNGSMFSMHLFLPKKRFGLENLLRKAASEGGFLQQDFELSEKDSYVANIWIPKFKFSNLTSKGPKTMQKMGLKSLFDRNSSELKEMGNGGGLSVSKIVQKCFIQVDEEGTKAAVLTTKASGMSGCSSPPKEFIANRPFMFMIREEKSKTILFTGVVLNPKRF